MFGSWEKQEIDQKSYCWENGKIDIVLQELYSIQDRVHRILVLDGMNSKSVFDSISYIAEMNVRSLSMHMGDFPSSSRQTQLHVWYPPLSQCVVSFICVVRRTTTSTHAKSLTQTQSCAKSLRQIFQPMSTTGSPKSSHRQ